MWKRLAALAALAIAPCAFAQVSSPPAPLTLDEAVSRVARTHPDLRLPELKRTAAQARLDGAAREIEEARQSAKEAREEARQAAATAAELRGTLKALQQEHR